jgi:amino acid adenylation domain-containing protein
LIAEAARSAPDAVAVRHGDDRISYGALMAAAGALACELATLGVGPGDAVGVCVERSVDHVAAVLGALRAGAAFLPIDPQWPEERIRRLLDDAAAPAVIAPGEAGRLAGEGRVVLDSRRDAPRRAGASPSPTPGAGDVAYVIYTSGSTGEPKGVEISHGALAALVDWHCETFGVTEEDHCGWVAGLGFDASVWELLPSLASGATVHAADEASRSSADALRRWLVDQDISIAYVPTPLAELLITADWPAGTKLHTLLTGGDVLHARPKPGLPFEVVNNYGPTECAVVAASGVVAPQSEASETPTIGRPIDGCRIHILDPDGRPVSEGGVGELHIAGDNVGIGYRNRPAATAERFISVSLPGRPTERCYRTGDLGSWTRDGEIAFHGRADDQIKLRGHRIEPDEISAALSGHPHVVQSAVVAEGEGADGRLIAYVVPSANRAPRGMELRDYLAARLPSYMLPDAFVRLSSLPMTYNGKLDRAALPRPTPANTLPSAAYRAPETPVEQQVTAIVAQLLALESVGLDDNFFLLGGHSLLGAQLVLRLRDVFGAELTLRDLFEAQTIENLAAKVESAVVVMVASMSTEEVRKRLASMTGSDG